MSGTGPWQGERVLVTGGLGFVGSNLAHALVAAGADVTLLDNRMPGGGANPANLEGIRDEVRTVEGDIRDARAYDALDAAPSVVFHLAARLEHRGSVDAALEDLSINATGTLTLLEAVRTRWPGARFVYAGTRSQYGRPAATPVTEESPMVPLDPNGVSKATGEAYALLYHRVHGVAATSLRLTNLYGPRHLMHRKGQGFVAWFLRQAMDGGEIELWGGGRATRDLLHVDDAVDALMAAATREEAVGLAFNVASGRPATVREIAERIVKVTGKGRLAEKAYPPGEARVEVGDFVASIERARNVLGWSPRVPLERGLEATVRYYERHREDHWHDPSHRHV